MILRKILKPLENGFPHELHEQIATIKFVNPLKGKGKPHDLIISRSPHKSMTQLSLGNPKSNE